MDEDLLKVKQALSILNKLTRETGFIISGIDNSFFITARKGNERNQYLILFEGTTATYYTHDKPRRIEADSIKVDHCHCHCNVSCEHIKQTV